MTTQRVPTGHNASAHPEPTASAHPGHKAGGHEVSTLRMAAVLIPSGFALVWFARAVLTVPTSVVLAVVLTAAVATAAGAAGWIARGRTDGR